MTKEFYILEDSGQIRGLAPPLEVRLLQQLKRDNGLRRVMHHLTSISAKTYLNRSIEEPRQYLKKRKQVFIFLHEALFIQI